MLVIVWAPKALVLELQDRAVFLACRVRAVTLELQDCRVRAERLVPLALMDKVVLVLLERLVRLAHLVKAVCLDRALLLVVCQLVLLLKVAVLECLVLLAQQVRAALVALWLVVLLPKVVLVLPLLVVKDLIVQVWMALVEPAVDLVLAWAVLPELLELQVHRVKVLVDKLVYQDKVSVVNPERLARAHLRKRLEYLPVQVLEPIVMAQQPLWLRPVPEPLLAA